MINKIEINIDKVRAHKMLNYYCREKGLSLSNTCVGTLLLPPGSRVDEQDLLQLGLKLFIKVGYDGPLALSIEPVLSKNNYTIPRLYLQAGFKSYQLLPSSHIHFLIEEFDDIVNLREKWYQIVKSRDKRLFQCSLINEGIEEITNYLTKFFEEKRGCQGLLAFKDYQKANNKSKKKTLLVQSNKKSKSHFRNYIELNQNEFLFKCEYVHFYSFRLFYPLFPIPPPKLKKCIK